MVLPYQQFTSFTIIPSDYDGGEEPSLGEYRTGTKRACATSLWQVGASHVLTPALHFFLLSHHPRLSRPRGRILRRPTFSCERILCSCPCCVGKDICADALRFTLSTDRPLHLTAWCRKYTVRHHHNTQTVAVPFSPKLHTFGVSQRPSTAITLLSILTALPIVHMLSGSKSTIV